MGILATLQEEMKSAMKARDQVRLDALRLMVSAIKYAEVDTPNLSDQQVQAVLQKEGKKRREAIAAYTAGGRPESAAKEQYELSLIEEYLPKMMSEEEVRAKVKDLFGGKQADNLGAAIGMAMAAMKGQAEGGVVARVVKEIYDQHQHLG